jgi:hypothetical protein
LEGVVAIFVCVLLAGIATLTLMVILLPIYVLVRTVLWITRWKVL